MQNFKMSSKPPELSIFQGAQSIYVDNNHARIEEEEALEDQKRRRGELQLELEKNLGHLTFDDEDDPEETINSTGNDRHSNIRNNFHQDFPLRDDFTNLRNLVETKSRELEEISTLLTSERTKHKCAIEEYEKRLSIAEAEKERALMNRNQTHELLVENKGRLIELNDKNQAHLSKIKSLENENEQLVGEIEGTKLMLSDVQTKYGMVEKNVLFNAERNTDLIIKQSQERHNAQMTMMQQQIDNLKSKHDDLEHEYKHLDIRYKELHRSREAMLIEKSEIINQLNRNLEESQRQCQNLLSRPDMSQEYRRLQNALQTLEYEKEELSVTVNMLQKKIQEQTSEMEMMDSIINECDGNNQSYSEMSKFIQRDPSGNVNSTPFSADAKVNKVKEELCKSLNNIKRKREEIKILEKQLSEKDTEIAELKRDESKVLIELNKYREETFRLETKFNSLQKELEKAENELKICKNDDLKEKNDNLCRQLDNKKQEIDELRNMIEKLKIHESEFSINIEIEQKKIEELTNKLIEMKSSQVIPTDKHNKSIQSDNEARSCAACEEHFSKISKLELHNSKLEHLTRDYLVEINDLKEDLAQAQHALQSIKEKMNLQSVMDKEIEKLQVKAKEFETFMKTNSRKDSITSSKDSQSISTNTSHTVSSPEAESRDAANGNGYNESKIRDEMARIFANQIKLIEKKFIDETRKLQYEITSMVNELEKKTADLEVTSTQLDLLKFTIVHERQEFEEALKMKDEHYKHNIEQYRKHVDDLNSQIDMIDDERKKVQKVKEQIEADTKVLRKREDETLQKLKKLQQDSTKIIEELSDKYKTAKKTALNYKQYSDDKEKHYRSECERIKNGYAEAVEKIQTRVNETLKEKEQAYNEKLKEIEKGYTFKIDILKEMLEKSQK